MSEDEFDEDALLEPLLEDQLGSVTSVPTVEYYQRRYAHSLSNNDQKAARLFKEYESVEKVRRLQQELLWVRNGQVLTQTLENILGKTRKSKYSGFENWAKLMLLWVAQAKK